VRLVTIQPPRDRSLIRSAEPPASPPAETVTLIVPTVYETERPKLYLADGSFVQRVAGFEP
jgi:hypothetical protein